MMFCIWFSYGIFIGLFVFSIMMVCGLVLVIVVISVFWLLGRFIVGMFIDLVIYCLVNIMVIFDCVVSFVVVVMFLLLV